MDPQRKPTLKSTPRSKSTSSTSRSSDSISKSIGPISSLGKDVQMNEKEVEHEVEIKYTGLPTMCKNCGITFGSYLEYYSHLVYSSVHAPQLQMQPPVDLELKLAINSQPDIDLELRLRPPTNQKK
ncbi:hypothetical protein POM88_049043 [Heracleum sosnowskyi]|uniref:Uncharacterized protein n=1 Tax=Heracleum sosnowskyi TaxID=360622 RepID=A0AAD8M178_9APIA|nr:hypothetical protein POM88_049043 [Heracleum sosnowskyi]